MEALEKTLRVIKAYLKRSSGVAIADVLLMVWMFETIQ
jgi:hypothetical protein